MSDHAATPTQAAPSGCETSASHAAATGEATEPNRRSAFESNAAIWGVKARLHVSMHLVAPSGIDELIDDVLMCGFVGLERTRTNLPWALANATVFDNPAALPFGPSALHPTGFVNGGPLLPEFSSPSLPRLRVVTQEGANRRIEMLPSSEGVPGPSDVILGWRWPRCFSARANFPGEDGEHAMLVSTPVEAAVIDVWIHRGLAFERLHGFLYSTLPSGPKYPGEGREAGLLLIQGELQSLESENAALPDFRPFAEMLRFGAMRLGFKPEDFVGYRWRLSYPPIPTMMILRHALLPMIATRDPSTPRSR